MEHITFVLAALAAIVAIGLFATKADVQALRAEVNRLFATKSEVNEAFAKIDKVAEKIDDVKQLLYTNLSKGKE